MDIWYTSEDVGDYNRRISDAYTLLVDFLGLLDKRVRKGGDVDNTELKNEINRFRSM